MRIAHFSLFLLAGCPAAQDATQPAPVVAKAPEVRGYSFLVCADPLRDDAVSVEFTYLTSASGLAKHLSLRPMESGSNFYCGQPDEQLFAGVPMSFYLIPADMTLVREIGIAYPSPDYSDDEASPNLTATVRQTDEQGRFPFLIVPEARGVKTVRMGTVRPGRPITELFPPTEKPAEDTTSPPAEQPATTP